MKHLKKFNESLSEEDIQNLNNPDYAWVKKIPVINLSKNEIRALIIKESAPPPGGFNRNIFGTVRETATDGKSVTCLVEFMNLSKQDDRLFGKIADHLSKSSGLKVGFRVERPDNKYLVRYKFNL